MSFCPGTSPSSLKKSNERGAGIVPRRSSQLAREQAMTRSFATARLSVDPVTAVDLPFLVGLWSDTRVVRMLGGPRSVEQVERMLDEAIRHWQVHGFGRWVIRRAGVPLGTVKLATCRVLGRDEVELGCALAPGATATPLRRAVVRYLSRRTWPRCPRSWPSR